VFAQDVLQCTCGGRRTVVAFVADANFFSRGSSNGEMSASRWSILTRVRDELLAA
jgi:hypothetical protein